jgi:opacity protein-like surface antigen
MKKSFYSIITMLIAVGFISIGNQAFGQQGKVALGIQYQTLTFGASAKYNIDDFSSIQASINPISSDNLNLNFYGGRYYYNFFVPSNKVTPYLFAGAGVVTYKVKLAAATGGILSDISGNFFGFNAGGGIKAEVIKNLELSGDLGYGKLNLNNGISAAGLNLGFGIHYYIN